EGLRRRVCAHDSSHFETRTIAKLPYMIIDSKTDDGYTLGSGKEMIVTATPTSRKFVNLYMDDVLVDKANYEFTEGSTIIALSAAYMETLSEGPHTMRLEYTDGSIEYTFNVSAKAQGGGDAEQTNAKTGTTPKTGDKNNIWLFMGLAMLSIGGALITVKSKKAVK
ncbi:MAG: LPXTG cell wall anchor domain-containing protein, partial [Clostridia bacterium]|nr:LPXTG cell wall anchor domain-containing protein [Clostridia bacterium]